MLQNVSVHAVQSMSVKKLAHVLTVAKFNCLYSNSRPSLMYACLIVGCRSESQQSFEMAYDNVYLLSTVEERLLLTTAGLYTLCILRSAEPVRCVALFQ